MSIDSMETAECINSNRKERVMKPVNFLFALLVILACCTNALAAEKNLSQSIDDAQKEGRIYASYALNRHLNPFEFKVTVDGNKAIINGVVEEAIDKELAEQIALNVSGITKVENQIVVNESAPRAKTVTKSGQSFGTAVEDATITASVKSKLLWNKNTEGLDIHVETKNGLVTLSGKTNTGASKDLAGYLAANTDGVRDVDNQLAVTSKETTSTGATLSKADKEVSDAWITTKVKSSFMYSKNVSARDITVNTEGGVVSLSGVVDADSEKELAIDLAKNVRGVKEVNASALNVKS
jgi:hyperosmotically inducible protein